MSSSVTSFDLASPIGPWVVVARNDDRMAHEKVAALAPGGVVRRLDSRRMVDAAGLFAEFSDKLEFPSYFGHNWYALVDCLDDLHGSWHDKRPVVIVVEEADVLVGKDFFPLFISLLCEAAERANLSLDADGLPRNRPPFPLHFMFFLARCEVREVAKELSSRDDMLVRESDGRLLVWSQPE
ncbi:barstar family protein [Micromonospora sp. NPDC005220]|uniref:barstar family protein n=1 Tax=Micromonospora sp. NPDC005220 TaxID=3155589 RepID=UPI0033B9D97A